MAQHDNNHAVGMETGQPEHHRHAIQQLRDLPPLPAVAQRLLLQLKDDTVDVAELSSTIEMDPALAARLIGLANSAYYARSRRVYSAREAIIKLGLALVQSLTMAMVVDRHFDTGGCPNFEPERYWYTALLSALGTGRTVPHAREHRDVHQDRGYICGLLHSLGIPAMVHCFPEAMSAAFAAAASDPDGGLRVAEQEWLGIDHHSAGAWLTRHWHLPEEVVFTAAHYHEPATRETHWPYALMVGHWSRFAKAMYHGQPLPDAGELEPLRIPRTRLSEIHRYIRSRDERLWRIVRGLTEENDA